MTSNHDNRPYTIFTLCDYDPGDYSDGKIGSKLFRTIALQVLRNEESELKKKKVVQWLQTNCKQEGRVKGFFGEVIKLFGEQQELKIIGNKDLNKILSQLASHFSSYVAIANKSIEVTVPHRFNEGSK